VEKKDIADWCIIADLEPATVALGSFIPQLPARKKKKNFKIDDRL
jgi:hypothetical protein